jgi:hypothetical protein
MSQAQAAPDAHVIALELMKQLITLSAGVIGLSATFIEKFSAPWTLLPFLALSWTALLICVFFSLQTISAIVKSRLDSDADWSRNAGQTYARLSKYAFLTGISIFAAYAFLSVLSIRSSQTNLPPPAPPVPSRPSGGPRFNPQFPLDLPSQSIPQ